MENIVFECKFCSKSFGSKYAIGSHLGKCKMNPNAKQKSQSAKWYESMKRFDHKSAILNTMKIVTCPFCNKVWKTTSSGFGTHKRRCKKNPDRIPSFWEGKHHSEETKKKISEGDKKAHDEGRGHTWKNRYLNPSYAEQWLYGLLDNNNVIYEKEKPFFGFFLDVAIGNKCIEIDGEQHGEDTRFPEQLERDKRKDKLLVENGWQELRIKWSDVKKDTEKYASLILDFIKEET
jgi:very-short-patch-repair endonuclease